MLNQNRFSSVGKVWAAGCAVLAGLSSGMTRAEDSNAELNTAPSSTEYRPSPIGTIFGANHFSKDWGVTVGVKAWMNEWNLPADMDFGPGGTASFVSSTETAFIPAFLVRHKNFFIGGSYIPETKYSFSNQYLGNAHDIPNLVVDIELTNGQITAKPTGKRSEYDFNVGYFVTPNLALSLGYKELKRKYEIIYTLEDYNLDPTSQDESIKGLLLGLSASAPIGEKLSLYGNFAYGPSFDVKNSDVKDVSYYLGEVGLNYTIPLSRGLSAITISAGYRYQKVSMTYSAKQGDIADGFTLGVAASF